jgi:hypothetical protein
MDKWLTGGVQNYYTPQVSGLPVEYKIMYATGTLLTHGVQLCTSRVRSYNVYATGSSVPVAWY